MKILKILIVGIFSFCILIQTNTSFARNHIKPKKLIYPTDVLAPHFAKDHPISVEKWLEKIGEKENKKRLKRSFKDLTLNFPRYSFERQKEFYEELHQFGYLEYVNDELDHETLKQLDELIGEGAAAEYLAQVYYHNAEYEGRIRATASQTTLDKITAFGPKALPALYRILWAEEHPKFFGFQSFLCSAIIEIGNAESVEEMFDRFTLEKDGYSTSNYFNEREFAKLNFDTVPTFIEYLNHDDKRLRILSMQGITQITGQKARWETQLGRKHRYLMKKWWDKNKNFYLALEKNELNCAEPVNKLVLCTPSYLFSGDKGVLGIGYQFFWLGDKQYFDISTPTAFDVTVIKPDKTETKLVPAQEIKPTKQAQMITAVPKAESVEAIIKEKRPMPRASFAIGTRWFKDENGRFSENLFNEPGEYKVQFTVTITDKIQSGWNGKITSEWVTVWNIDPYEWLNQKTKE